MKKLLVATLLAGITGLAGLAGLSSCGAPAPNTSATADVAPGAATPEAAVQRFFSAVHSQNLQAMGAVWGTTRGAARDNMDRTQLEQREVILQCYFNYDAFRILGESPTSEGRRIVRVELVRGGKTRTPTIWTVRGPDSRWYVENLDIAAVRDFCGTAPDNPTGL